MMLQLFSYMLDEKILELNWKLCPSYWPNESHSSWKHCPIFTTKMIGELVDRFLLQLFIIKLYIEMLLWFSWILKLCTRWATSR